MTDQTPDAMEVLAMSNDAPSFPFDGGLEYEGIHAVPTVFRRFENDEIYEIRGTNRNLIPNHGKYGNKHRVKEHNVYDDMVAGNMLNACALFEYVWEETDYSYILYKHEGTVFVTQITYRIMFGIYPEDTHRKYYAFLDTEVGIHPETHPAMTELTGTFVKKMRGDIVFEENSWLSLFNKTPKLTLDEIQPDKPEHVFDIASIEDMKTQYQGRGSSSKQKQYHEVKSLSKDDDSYYISCEHPDGKVRFSLSLTEFGTLPEWAYERIEPTHLIQKLESGETLLAEIHPVEDNSPSRWTSVDGEKELIMVE